MTSAEMYEDMVLNCFRFLGFTSLYDVEVLRLPEYALRMKAYELAQVDKKFDMHLQAWLNYQVQATEKQGSKTVPVFKSFRQFFDYESEIKQVKGEPKKRLTDRQREIARKVARLNSL